MQTPNDVFAVMNKLSQLGFSTGMLYAHIGSFGNACIWVGHAEHGRHRRYFQVMHADSAAPVLGLLPREESERSIDRANATRVVEHVLLEHLIKDGYNGVLRGLGLYGALVERGSITLADFKPLGWETPRPEGHFSVVVYKTNSLELYSADFFPGMYSEKEAYELAGIWSFGSVGYLGTVVNNLGNVVAVYHKGKHVA
jgi:hypothetical protein